MTVIIFGDSTFNGVLKKVTVGIQQIANKILLNRTTTIAVVFFLCLPFLYFLPLHPVLAV